MLHSKCGLFQKGWMLSPLNAQSSVPFHLHLPGTEGGEIRFTPHLWEKKGKQMLGRAESTPPSSGPWRRRLYRAPFTFPPSSLALGGHKINFHARNGHGQPGGEGGCGGGALRGSV